MVYISITFEVPGSDGDGALEDLRAELDKQRFDWSVDSIDEEEEDGQ